MTTDEKTIFFQVEAPKNDHLKHLVGICLYKEPIQLMVDTVESIAVQPMAREKISVVVGMEAGTPDRVEVSGSSLEGNKQALLRKSWSSCVSSLRDSIGSWSLLIPRFVHFHGFIAKKSKLNFLEPIDSGSPW